MRAAAGTGPACKAVRRFTWFLEAFAIAVTRRPKARAFTMFMEPHLSKEAGQQQACRAIEVRYRRNLAIHQGVDEGRVAAHCRPPSLRRSRPTPRQTA